MVLPLLCFRQQSLFNCDVNIGICPDASATSIDFYGSEGNDAYVRHAIRGESAIFECLEQKDIVLQGVVPSTTNSKIEEFTQGDSVVYVPLIGQRSDVGVIEIHGFYTQGVTDLTRSERPTGVLKSMMHNKDYR